MAVHRRCRYTRFDTAESVLQLKWALGAGGSSSIIPASAYGPIPLNAPQLEREKLRRRLYEPDVPWQTYYYPDMGAHTLAPTGLVVSATPINIATGVQQYVSLHACTIASVCVQPRQSCVYAVK